MSKVSDYEQEIRDAIRRCEEANQYYREDKGNYKAHYGGNLPSWIETLIKDNTLAITALRAQIEPGWIKVSERLPDSEKEVLVWSPRYKNQYLVSRIDGRWIPFGSGRALYDTVTHWMPLPEPPSSNLIPSESTQAGAIRQARGDAE